MLCCIYMYLAFSPHNLFFLILLEVYGEAGFCLCTFGFWIYIYIYVYMCVYSPASLDFAG
ncbi:uncharacterized protein DS421_7g212140 [Arachis hypogaea]|nr:uncharacterized protein DS421_7g212140 [Arachis hypogaea]